MAQDRRTFLASLGAATLGLVACRPAGAGAFAAAQPRRIRRPGIQLYTLRRAAAADLAGTLAELARIGYREIEFAGYYGKSATEVRAMLDAGGLTSPSTHLGLDAIAANPSKVFADARTLGQRWITVPSLPSGPKGTIDDWKRMAAQFNAAGRQVRDAGLRFAFHNHNAEFKPVAGVIPFDILLAETDPALVDFQLDIHWAVAGGADPVALFARFPGRFPMVHLKDSAGPPEHRQTDLGQGTIPFARILGLPQAATIEHYFVEHDSPADPMAFARSASTWLSTLTF